jgi:hypothetical protein
MNQRRSLSSSVASAAHDPAIAVGSSSLAVARMAICAPRAAGMENRRRSSTASRVTSSMAILAQIRPVPRGDGLTPSALLRATGERRRPL